MTKFSIGKGRRRGKKIKGEHESFTYFLNGPICLLRLHDTAVVAVTADCSVVAVVVLVVVVASDDGNKF